MSPRPIRPWMVALALALAGVIGATLVYQAGQRIHARDRRAITTWHTAVAPSLQALRDSAAALAAVGSRAFDGRLDDRQVRGAVTQVGTHVETARATLQKVRAPEIVEVIARAYGNGADASIAALSSLRRWSSARNDAARTREAAAYQTHVERARRILREADRALTDLRSRYEID